MAQPTDEERRALSVAETQERDLRARGVFFAPMGARESKLMQDILTVGAIAKTASRQRIGVKALREGKMEMLEENLGHEDMIFMSLMQGLAQRYAAEATR